MRQQTNNFSGKAVTYYFDAAFLQIEKLLQKDKAIIITDENVFKLHGQKFAHWKTIVLKAGEKHKQQSTVDDIIQQLIKLEADRGTFIVGIGGGVVTDIAGYAATVYMRGVRFAFVPTTILAMVDAAIGGKNGVDAGIYKNLVGTVKQPEFLLYDYSFLQTLPQTEWINGFAEIIKHACIKDAHLFAELESTSVDEYKNEPEKLAALIEKNVAIKTNVVLSDEHETGERKLLNFGHTLGHAIENIYHLPHGHAVSIGMVAAAIISEEINNFSSAEKEKIENLLQQYQLPVAFKYDKQKAFQLIKSDKKRSGHAIHYILLNKIGEGIVQPVSFDQLQNLFNQSL